MLVVPFAAYAQSSKTEREVAAFRAEIRTAVKAKDHAALARYFADGFSHTHASGKVDDKAARIDFFVKGEPSIEDVEPEEIRFNVINKNVVTANGKTTLLFGTEKRTFQWTGVFVKQKGKWTVAATHATLLRT